MPVNSFVETSAFPQTECSLPLSVAPEVAKQDRTEPNRAIRRRVRSVHPCPSIPEEGPGSAISSAFAVILPLLFGVDSEGSLDLGGECYKSEEGIILLLESETVPGGVDQE